MVVSDKVLAAALADFVRSSKIKGSTDNARSFSVGDKVAVNLGIVIGVNNSYVILYSSAEAVEVKVCVVCKSDGSLSVGRCNVVYKKRRSLELISNLNVKR